MSHHTPRAAQHYTALHSTTHPHTHTHTHTLPRRTVLIALDSALAPFQMERKIQKEDTGGRYGRKIRQSNETLSHSTSTWFQ